MAVSVLAFEKKLSSDLSRITCLLALPLILFLSSYKAAPISHMLSKPD